MASAELNKVLELLKSQPRNPNATVAQMRAGMEKVSERVARDVTCEGLRIGDLGAEWIVPPEAASDRVILYLHGGGYVMGSIATHRATVARIARAAKARALAIEYRLAPEHQFPAAVDDALAAYKWLLGQGYKPGKIVIAGDSAGGGLTLATLLAIRDAKLPMAAAGVAISPWADLEGTGDSHKTRAHRDPMVGSAKHSVRWRNITSAPRTQKTSAGLADPRRLSRVASATDSGWRCGNPARRFESSRGARQRARGSKSSSRSLGRHGSRLARLREDPSGGTAGDR